MARRLLYFTAVCLCVCGLNAVLYDCVSGKPANWDQLRKYEEKNITAICTVDVKPCDPKEWRRVDGSCNNLKYPSRGTHRTPTHRIFKPLFSSNENYDPRKGEDGEDLELPRVLRTELLSSGKVSDSRLTQLVAYYALFSLGDISTILDITILVTNITYCCEAQGAKEINCASNKIPADDPVHRYSGIRCMNLTKPSSFQSYGCLDNGTEFAKIVFQTPVFDLSNTYNLVPGNINMLRTYQNGMMKIEEENGFLFPPTDPEQTTCFLNEAPRETRCNLYQANNAIGPNTLNILFYVQHNRIAQELHEMNPCWDDERLFYTARDINIAINMQILLYELFPTIFGQYNMIRDGVICANGGFRDTYNENIPPQVSDEYVYVNRWFHTVQETTMKLYDEDGYYLKSVPMVNCSARTGFLPLDNNMLHLIQGSFRQPGGSGDFVIDYDMADRVLGGIQLSSDVGTSDLSKGRLLGLHPYVKYREYCTKKKYKCFDDLKDSICPERIYRLKQKYKSVNDIDLLSGLWAEKHVKGGMVPQTMYCLMTTQLKRMIASDRHCFERPNRPHAFTSAQLNAIRKVTIAGMLCTVGKFVKEIQPRAFNVISPSNCLTKCSSPKIGKLDLSPWKDCKCDKKT